MNDTTAQLESLASQRILVLDGAMGSEIQRFDLREHDFRGQRFAHHSHELKGNNDVLVLTRPDVVASIHEAYLEAGSDIIETNTFGATAVAQADYGLESVVYDMNVAAAQLAREACEKWTRKDPRKPRLVAGSIGPMNKTLSMSPRVGDPAYRAVTFAQVRDAYREQVRGLLDGGADLLLAETVFDTLNLKACIVAMEEEFILRGQRVPVMLSVTITDKSGRTLSGQTLEAFWTSIVHARPFSVGINCALGAAQMRPYIEELAQLSPTRISCYPNAGLPNAFGEYDETPDVTSRLLASFAHDRLVDIVGGCCGTTPAHIRAIARAVATEPARVIAVPQLPFSRFSGLEPLVIRPESNFLLIGERTNVTGSKKFSRLIQAGDFQAAVAVALDQVRGGANILDVNMDEGMLDSEQAMTTFLHLLATEPEVARIPVMIDSSKWSVLEAGLQCLQGKGIVNSISLKDGAAEFVRRAQVARKYGAGIVVMAFDEAGQADTTQRKVDICLRAWKLLEGIDFDQKDVIFDPNILAIGTGIEEHARYAVDFMEATRILKRECPLAKVSGGVSNLSFSFRGNDAVREAMNSAFLFHAIRAGLDMGIVNAGQLAVYEEIAPELREHVEDVVLDRRPDATERLVAFAATVAHKGMERKQDLAWRQGTVEARISHALVHGMVDFIAADVAEALEKYPRPLDIIEGPMMAGMAVVGDLFGAGKMFLPQVVKSARVMKKGVAVLEPVMAVQKGGAQTFQGKVLLATVKGDVHDIGKNIVGVVLGCNNYEVIDLGVLQPCETILQAAIDKNVDIIGLSGLITPSLDEMVHVAREMQRKGMKQPLLIGGATTSKQHTAVKIAPACGNPVVHVLDASRAAGVVSALLSAQKAVYLEDNAVEQERLRQVHLDRAQRPLLSLAEAQARRPQLSYGDVVVPQVLGRVELKDVPLAELVPYIDWTFLFIAWELKGKFPRILQHPEYGAQATELYQNATALLDRIVREGLLTANAAYGFWPANSDANDIVLFADEKRTQEVARFAFLRQQQEKQGGKPQLCLADYVAPLGTPDYVGAFAVTAGIGADALVRGFEAQSDDYNAIMVKALADRLAEALAEWLHQRARRQWYAPGEKLSQEDLLAEKFRGIRPAMGYPACPDHTDKRKLFALLQADRIGMSLTDSLAMTPPASVSGLYLAHPEAQYFALGRVGQDQRADYARRKGVSEAEVAAALRGTVADPL